MSAARTRRFASFLNRPAFWVRQNSILVEPWRCNFDSPASSATEMGLGGILFFEKKNSVTRTSSSLRSRPGRKCVMTAAQSDVHKRQTFLWEAFISSSESMQSRSPGTSGVCSIRVWTVLTGSTRRSLLTSVFFLSSTFHLHPQLFLSCSPDFSEKEVLCVCGWWECVVCMWECLATFFLSTKEREEECTIKLANCIFMYWDDVYSRCGQTGEWLQMIEGWPRRQ